MNYDGQLQVSGIDHSVPLLYVMRHFGFGTVRYGRRQRRLVDLTNDRTCRHPRS